MFPSDDLGAQLRRIFNLRTPSIGEPPPALEEGLVGRLRQRSEPAPRRSLWAFFGDHRWAFAGLALAVGACTVPVDYQRSFGASVDCTLADEAVDEDALTAMTEELRVAVGAESIAMRIMRSDDDEARVRVDVWGDLDDEDEALATIRELAPPLATASCAAQALEGTVHGTLGGRLGYHILDLDLLDRADASATRESILEELSAQGFRGSAEVEIEETGGRRRVKISLEERYEIREGDEPPAGIELRGGGRGEGVEIERERVINRDGPGSLGR